MINTTALLQVLSGPPSGASASPGGAANSGANGSGIDFAQQLQRLTQANALSEQQAAPAPPAPPAPTAREPSAAKATSSEGEAQSPESEDETGAERAEAAEEAPANPAPRKSTAPRKARSEATDEAKDRPTPGAPSAQEAEETRESAEPDTGRMRARKPDTAPAEGHAEVPLPGLTPTTALPQPRGAGRGEAADPAEASRIDRPLVASQAADALQATVQAAVVRRALLAASEPSGAAALQAAISETTDGGTPLPEGLAPVLSPITLANVTTTMHGQPADSRIATAPSTDSSTAASTAAHRTEDVDGTVGSPMFFQSLGARVSLLARDGIEQARLNVHPADMGPIAVRLALEGTQVRVDLSAEMGSTRQALEQSLPALATALQDAGFTLAGGGVFQQARDDRQPQRGDGGTPASRDHTTPVDAGDLAGPSASRPSRPRGLVDLIA